MHHTWLFALGSERRSRDGAEILLLEPGFVKEVSLWGITPYALQQTVLEDNQLLSQLHRSEQVNMHLATAPPGPFLQSSYLMSSPLRNRIRSPALRAAFSAGLPARMGDERGFSWGSLLGGLPCATEQPRAGTHWLFTGHRELFRTIHRTQTFSAFQNRECIKPNKLYQ